MVFTKMKKVIIAATVALFMSGCAQQSFVMSDNNSVLKEENSQHFFINGLAQEKEINASDVCGGTDKVAKVEVQQTFLNGVLRAVTLGIYTPREARVYCKS